MTPPFTRDRWNHCVETMTSLRERRLLQMAGNTGFNHKGHYGEYLFLMGNRSVQWSLGMAFITERGKARLAELIEAGV